MKNNKKILPVIIAFMITISLAFTSGCGGCLGALGLLGCVSACSGVPGNIVDIPDPFDIPDHFDIDTDLPEESTTEKSTEESTEQSTQSDNDSTPSESGEFELAYTEYDPSGFNSMCDELRSLASGNDTNAVISTYEAILNEFKWLDENSTKLYVQYSCDPSDEYLNDRYQKDSSMETECLDNALTAIKAVCDGPCADAFKEYVGEVDFEEFSSYEPMTEEEKEIDDRITALISEYYSDIEMAEESGMSDEELNQIVGPLYLELVSLRNSEAMLRGYDNYAEYADEQIYNRDFDESEIEAFREAVKKMSGRAYDLMYYSSAYSAPFYLDFEMDNDQLIDALTKYGAMISPLAEQSGNLLTSKKLYNIGNDSTRMEGAYTVTMEGSGVPYIFANTEGASGFVTMSHEFGHFTEASINRNPNALLYGLGALELCEIHSNGLQALYSNYYNEIYGQYANEMEAYLVIDLLSNVTEGCLFDEFQRAVYKNPDMNLDELNQLYHNICEAYGSPTSSDDYWWMYVSHNFESPMYYFSYAASGIVALQIWSQAQGDFDQAVSTWESIVNAGAYDYGYMELLENLGISTFNDTATVAVICDQALNFVEMYSVSYGNNQDYSDNFPGFDMPGEGDLEDWFNSWLDQFGNLFP